MKVLFLSDLHLDVNRSYLQKDLVPSVIAYIQKKQIDVWILAGDVAGEAEETLAILEVIQQATGVLIRFVPGNHDIWTHKDSSWDAYQLLANHETSLMNRPFEIGEYVVIGDMGWYDYSFKPTFTNIEEIPAYKQQLWNDARYAKWGMNDQALYARMHETFTEQLTRYADKKVIFVNHFVPYTDFLVFKQDLSWNIANSFMGSVQLGALLDQFENIEYVVFGHTHKRFGQVAFGKKTIICNPLGYVGEWTTRNIDVELEKAGIILTL